VSDATAIEIADNPERDRYEIRSDGELAGFVTYKRRPGRIAFQHTEVDERFEGQGIGSQLIVHVLDAAREAGDAVVPICPFVRAYIERHPGYADLVPEETREQLGMEIDG
jgi:predicted GNAT family acetyltransferase